MTTAGELPPGRRMWALERDAALRLLGSVAYGRVVFSEQAMPAIRLVNHLVDGGQVIIRTHLGARVLDVVGQVVAYEADAIDPDRHAGWSVVLTGWARKVTDPEQISRYQRELRPWVDLDQAMDQIIRIEPEVLTGYTLADPQDLPATQPAAAMRGARPGGTG